MPNTSLYALLLLLAAPAAADPAPVAWPTFLRAGPAEDTAALDEMDAGTFVDVQSCDARWCRVLSNRALGYLPRDLLAPTPASPPATGEQSCFISPAFTRHGEGAVTYCPKP